MIAATSIDSFQVHCAEGKRKAQFLTIRAALRSIFPLGMTRNEIARVLMLPIQSVCGRVNELRAEGFVVERERRLDPHTNRSGRVVYLAPDLIDKADDETIRP